MRVRSLPAVIDKLETAYVKFRYVADLLHINCHHPLKKKSLKVLPIQTPEKIHLWYVKHQEAFIAVSPVDNLEERCILNS